MIAAVGSYMRHIPQLAGVELLLADGELFVANVVMVKRSGTKVTFVSGEYGLTDFRAITKHIPQGIPVVLTVGGRGVIHRALDNGHHQNDLDGLKQVLPNAKVDDFYVQRAELGGCTMVSVARRKLIDDIIAQMGKWGLPLLGVSLGPFAVDLFKGYLFPDDAESRTIGRHRFTIQQGMIAAYNLLGEEAAQTARRVDIGGEQLNEWLVPAFAAAFGAISEIALYRLPISAIEQQAADYRQRWAFRRSGTVLMVLFLLVLLVNAFYFMDYSQKVAGFAGSDALTIQQEIDKLRKQSAERETLLEGLWHDDAARWGMAFMADRIAGTLPEGVRLRELAIYPRDEALSRKQRRPVHIPSAIRIRGTCGDMPQVNDWMKRLRSLAFCEDVEIEEYGFDEQDKVGVFSLQMRLMP
ncbi:hypothetical protein [Parapedobacter sp. DT-150]|uniref:hypothetical protein n=1 Tax=Parapedobacter sp. DT-150 TaxID=3396162 RepID=UPI003F1A6EB3